MQQYFSKSKKENKLEINEEDIHHIKNVMRMKDGDKIIIVHEEIAYNCILEKDYKHGTIESIYKKDTEKTYIKAYIPILPEEKMSFIIEKGTEMGVSEFTPINFERSKFKISKDKENKKIERWTRIAKEASEQSRRLIIPKIDNIKTVKEIEKIEGVNILCSLDKNNVKEIKNVLNERTLCDKITIVFGPEGGITKSEEEEIENKGYTKTSLGKNVLRTETVIINVCSIINYLNG
ncbi:MAG: 16S rRNA (uracil(1498)-N(3))-methyltransferase [Bacilli bacterium]|nr:16S rRNA (uracil(1498)-N(3))-methyltransferase [Bacilli bacterium]